MILCVKFLEYFVSGQETDFGVIWIRTEKFVIGLFDSARCCACVALIPFVKPLWKISQCVMTTDIIKRGHHSGGLHLKSGF